MVDKIKKWCIIVVDDKEIARRRSKAPGQRRKTMKMLTRKEAAERLGITPVTLSAWIKSGKIKVAHPGRAYKIPESEIERLLEVKNGRN